MYHICLVAVTANHMPILVCMDKHWSIKFWQPIFMNWWLNCFVSDASWHLNNNQPTNPPSLVNFRPCLTMSLQTTTTLKLSLATTIFPKKRKRNKTKVACVAYLFLKGRGFHCLAGLVPTSSDNQYILALNTWWAFLLSARQPSGTRIWRKVTKQW